MSKEKTLKSSKFAECYKEIRCNKDLINELSNLKRCELKSKLSELFPSVPTTDSLIRKVQDILKEYNTIPSETTAKKDASKEAAIEKADDFNSTNTDDNSKSNKHTDDKKNGDDNIEKFKDSQPKPSPNKNSDKKESNNSPKDLSLTANTNLNNIDSVIIDKNKVKTIDEMSIEVNTLKKEIENKDSEIDLLKSQLASAHEKIKSLSMANDEKQKEILDIQNSYADTSNNNCCTITLHHDMIRDLKSSYVNSKVVNSDSLVINGVDIANYCVKKAIAEAIYIYGIKI